MRAFSLLAVSALVISGCASIIDGTNQPVSVEAMNGSAAVVGASCKLSNSKGNWHVVTPGTTTVQRSYSDLQIDCRKAGLPPVVTAVKSSTKAMAFGNILLGGVIGAGVDIANGAAYDYPSPITVSFEDLQPSVSSAKDAQPVTVAAAGSLSQQPDEQARAAWDTLAASGCSPSAMPVKFKQRESVSFYEAFCSDGRLVHSVCESGSCRLRTSKD